MIELNVKFPPTVSQYMQSDARTRHIMGPWRSGKSVGSLIEIVRRAARQHRGPDGYRRSKWMVVRNTMKELKDTTLATWLAWFPDGSIGHWRVTGSTYYITVDDIRAEVMFRALDTAADVGDLLSLEITGCYFNEVREIAREILEGVDGRIGQYPSQKFGGCTWHGVWADTNPPEEGSYLQCMYEGLDPDDPRKKKDNSWSVFKQPPAVLKLSDGRFATNPNAENLENLITGYYENALKDKSDEYIRVNLMCEYGRSKGGKPVHPTFNRQIHVAKHELIPDRNLLLLLAMDFGLTPAIVFKQQNAFGQVLTLDEIVSFDMGIERAMDEKVLPQLRGKYDGFEIFVTGDPSGEKRSEADETACVDVIKRYKKKGIGKVKLAWSNAEVHRRGATDYFLSRLVDAGRPAKLIDPGCVWLIQGLNGKFMYKKTKDGRHSDDVDKNDWSHVCEADEYGDMYFERGGRRKAQLKEYDPFVQRRATPNIYATPR